MKNVSFRTYWIDSIFGRLEVYIDDVKFPYIKDSPEDNMTEEENGFVFTYSDLYDDYRNSIVNDGIAYEEAIKGIPLGLTKEDVVKMIEFQKFDEIARSNKSDNFMKIKNPIINVSVENLETIVKDAAELASKQIYESFKNRGSSRPVDSFDR